MRILVADEFPKKHLEGLRALGLTVDFTPGVKGDQLERQLTQGFMCYEPRLVRDTVRVQVSSAPSGSGKPTLFIEVSAVLRTEPLPVSMRVRAEVDVESGRVEIGEDMFQKEES